MAEQRERVDEHTTGAELGAGGGGSNDVDSGGGAAAGIPDGDTAMRMGDVVTRGDVERDRAHIFPEAGERRDAKDEGQGT
jgi:hypothetical protein